MLAKSGDYLLTNILTESSKFKKMHFRIITKSEFNVHTNPLFRELKILKLVDQITLLNCLFVHDYLN